MSIEQKMTKAYTAAGGRNVGAIPWPQIIQAIMSLFQGCITPAAAKRWARRNPDAVKDMIATKLKEEGSFSSTRDRGAAIEAAYKTFLAMSDDEIREARRS